MSLTIALVAAEPSGDQLGAGLMSAMRERRPEMRFVGVGGPRMIAAGLDAWWPMEALTAMGLVEVLQHLPRLLRLRRQLRDRLLAEKPDLVIGVDAPDFNLGLEEQLRNAGLRTVQFVSPTVWAWRAGRIKQLRRAADLVLSIFPFETELLEQQGVTVRYVGHPLAWSTPLVKDVAAARADMRLSQGRPVLAVLPGSRRGEVERLARPFLETARLCSAAIPELVVLVPAATSGLYGKLAAVVGDYPDLDIRLLEGQAQEVLTVADFALVASGTATLEALLHDCPMVVGYKVNGLTYWLARLLRLIKVEHVAMANLLAGERLAPEFIQGECEPERLAGALLALYRDEPRRQAIRERYRELHESLRMPTNDVAAEAVLALIPDRP